MRFQERQKTRILVTNKEHTRKLSWILLSGLEVGRVVVVTSSFSDSIVFAVHTSKTASSNYRFQIVALWRAFLDWSVSVDHFQRCSVDGSRIRNKIVPFSFENGVV